jgi:hypothetical protein
MRCISFCIVRLKVFHTKFLATANTEYFVLYAFCHIVRWQMWTSSCTVHFIDFAQELFWPLFPFLHLQKESLWDCLRICVPLRTFGVVWLPTHCTGFVHSFTLFISVTTEYIWIELNMRNLSSKAGHCFMRPVTCKRRGFVEQVIEVNVLDRNETHVKSCVSFVQWEVYWN